MREIHHNQLKRQKEIFRVTYTLTYKGNIE